jgi:hypothetical protein
VESVAEKDAPVPVSVFPVSVLVAPAFVVVDDYVYLVPFDEVGDVIILRTIIPSKKATRQYLEEKKRRS